MDAGNATRIVLRPLATPLPLGFLGLFVGTTMSSSLRLGWIPSADAHQVALALIVFTAPAQLIACIFGFLARDAVAATGMGLLFPAWLGLGVLLLATPAGETSAASGVFAVLAGIALLLPALIGATTKVVAGVVMTTTAVHFVVLGGYELTGTSTLGTAAGAIGLFLAAVALYAALAFELEDQRQRTILPVLRRDAAAAAMEPRLAPQLQGVENEAGVRQQL